MIKRSKFRPLLLTMLAVATITLGIPFSHLTLTAFQDRETRMPARAGHADDVSRLSSTAIREIVPISALPDEAEKQLVSILNRARRDQLPVSIAGARHSQGGHTIAADGIVVDMLPFRQMSLVADENILIVQAGALWADIIPFLDRHGRSVAIMQSDNSFSVGGSLSVNVHGWQAKRPPISASVRSFRLLMADGRILRCSRDENSQLFSLVLGGYGLFGIILDAELWTAPNEWYEVHRYSIPSERFAETFRERVDGDELVEMAYGRLRVTQKGFLEEAILTVYRKTDRASGPLPNLEVSSLNSLRRTIFRNSVGSDYGKRLRWNLETIFGEKIGADVVSRNQLLNGDVALYTSRSNSHTDIIHEYFLPPDNLADFLKFAREIIPRYESDLLNVTLRDVRLDDETFLRYAHQDMIAVVMLFNQARTDAAEADMTTMTRELIEASLNLGGRYYLPYRPHATHEQFLSAYPQAAELAAFKRIYDPDGMFRNQFYETYLSRIQATPGEE